MYRSEDVWTCEFWKSRKNKKNVCFVSEPTNRHLKFWDWMIWRVDEFSQFFDFFREIDFLCYFSKTDIFNLSRSGIFRAGFFIRKQKNWILNPNRIRNLRRFLVEYVWHFLSRCHCWPVLVFYPVNHGSMDRPWPSMTVHSKLVRNVIPRYITVYLKWCVDFLYFSAKYS